LDNLFTGIYISLERVFDNTQSGNDLHWIHFVFPWLFTNLTELCQTRLVVTRSRINKKTYLVN